VSIDSSISAATVGQHAVDGQVLARAHAQRSPGCTRIDRHVLLAVGP
jgi:hypothetical protein